VSFFANMFNVDHLKTVWENITVSGTLIHKLPTHLIKIQFNSILQSVPVSPI